MSKDSQSGIDDNTLFKDFQKGKYYLFEYFFDKYYRGLCVYACRLIQSRSIAEDLVQDFFIKLWEDKNKLQINSNVKSYFLRSVHNRCLNFLALDKMKKAHHNYQLYQFQQDSILQYSLLDFEMEHQLRKAIEALPNRIRETFVMNRLDGMTYQDIAEREGITIKAIEYRISKALSLLRKDLHDYLPLAWLFFNFIKRL